MSRLSPVYLCCACRLSCEGTRLLAISLPMQSACVGAHWLRAHTPRGRHRIRLPGTQCCLLTVVAVCAASTLRESTLTSRALLNASAPSLPAPSHRILNRFPPPPSIAQKGLPMRRCFSPLKSEKEKQPITYRYEQRSRQSNFMHLPAQRADSRAHSHLELEPFPPAHRISNHSLPLVAQVL